MDIDTSISRISADARRLLWIITRARDGVPEAFVEKVWMNRSLEDDKALSLARMVAALERMSPEVAAANADIPDDVRARFAELDERTRRPRDPIAPRFDELIAAGLIRRQALDDEVFESGIFFAADVVGSIDAWMVERPDERGERDEKRIRAAFGERYGAAFVAAVTGLLGDIDDSRTVAMGIAAVDELGGEGAAKNLSSILSDAVRAADDARLVGPVLHHVEQSGVLDTVIGAMLARGDGLGAAGALAALAGHYRAKGNIATAIDFESRALEPLANVVNSVIPRAIVHLRLSSDLLATGQRDLAAAHHLAAIVYRILVQAEPRAEMQALVTRTSDDASYGLPMEKIAEDPIFAAARSFMQTRSIGVDQLKADVEAIVARQTKSATP